MKEFILDTDSSFDRIGAVLAQTNENRNERVIAHGSKAMNKHELGYCITRKELLAIFFILLGISNITYMVKDLNYKDLNPKLENKLKEQA